MIGILFMCGVIFGVLCIITAFVGLLSGIDALFGAAMVIAISTILILVLSGAVITLVTFAGM